MEDTTTTPPGYAALEKQQQPGFDKQVNEAEVGDGSTGAFENDAKGKESEGVTGLKLFILLRSVTLVLFLMMMDISIVSTATPRITSDFKSLPDVGWYGSAYQLASASLQPLTGKFYTYFKSKACIFQDPWTFLAFFGIFELGSLICGVATSSKMLIVGRAVAGMGSSGLQNGALTIIATAVPMQKRPALMGMMMGVGQFGLIVAPLLGGALTEYTTWRWCFYINLPIGGLVAILLIFIRIPDNANKSESGSVFRTIIEKFDILGFTLFAPAAIQLLLALQYGGNEYAWNSATVIGLFCGAGGTFIVFLLWEARKGDDAMIPFSIMRQRIVWCSCIFGFFLMGTVMIASYYHPIYFQAVKGVSPTLSGVYLLPSILSQLMLAVMAGALVSRLGYYIPWAIFSGVVTAVGNGLISTFLPGTSTGKWIGYQIIVGAGRGSGFQMGIVAIQNALPMAQISIAMSVLMFFQTLGGAITITIADTIFNNSLKTEIPRYAPSVNAKMVISAGATAIRDVVSKKDLPNVLLAYSKSFDHVFYFAAGLSVAFFCFAWGLGWKDIRKKKAVGPGAAYAIKDPEMTIWLLDHGADPNSSCSIDLTPTSYAVEHASIDIIKLLFDRGADIRKGQLFHHAIERENDVIDVIDFLLDKGASINAKMYQDHYFSWRLYYFMGLGTSLHRAAELGKIDVVRYLLSQGADVNIKDAIGQTALDCAAKHGHSDIVDLLRAETAT
ncbi:MFS multidrug transporter [Paecilomyces variotii No. 5]|uniref:MFS multidrug transporter n=1 Tax=Byssochlamys spectabilis (strain No. 5 / NBRC 109023) TaxID=1356009 RepID=V5HQE4_BYSSN|nr:MFS multidrug transporter [Paecilomyces variotii No. 5]